MGPVTTRAAPSPRTVSRRLRRRQGAARTAGSVQSAECVYLARPTGVSRAGSVMLRPAIAALDGRLRDWRRAVAVGQG